jgi:pyruvate formate-lyase activating enzyme-like uncharacterized protein
MKNKARLLVTLDCIRDCSYCPNKHSRIIQQATAISDLKELISYREIMISGGEPTLHFEMTMRTVRYLKRQNPNLVLYVYFSLWKSNMIGLLEAVDGIQFTLHRDATAKEVADFYILQKDLLLFKEKSQRLVIIEKVACRIVIDCQMWKKVIVKPPRLGDNCIVPEDEDLYLLQDGNAR